MIIQWPLDLSPALSLAIFFVVGLCIGSFLNVVIVRLPRGRSLSKPSSRCGFCKSCIPFWMNIPVLSFVFSGGTCDKCGHAYSSRYVWIELLTAVVFTALGSLYGMSWVAWLYCFFAASLLAMTFIDLELRIIPDEISLGGWVVALLLALLQPAWFPIDFLSSLVGSLVGFLSFWMISRLFFSFTQEEGLGGGDVKLMGFVGALLGWQGVLTTVLVGNILGVVVGLTSIIFFKKTRRSPIPFGPFLALGALVHLFHLDDWWWK